MALTTINSVRSALLKLDSNRISREGTKRVFLSRWSNLKVLSLSIALAIVENNLHVYS